MARKEIIQFSPCISFFKTFPAIWNFKPFLFYSASPCQKDADGKLNESLSLGGTSSSGSFGVTPEWAEGAGGHGSEVSICSGRDQVSSHISKYFDKVLTELKLL